MWLDSMRRRKFRSLLAFLPAAFLFLFLIPILSISVSVSLDGCFQWTEVNLKPFLLRIPVAAPLLFTGSYLALSSILYLYRIGEGYPWGDARKSDETKTLVTEGPYRYTRNPMVLGYTLILSSLGILIGSVTMTLIIPSIILTIVSIWIKLKEEPALERRFGEAYLDYKRRVPFLIPKPKGEQSAEYNRDKTR